MAGIGGKVKRWGTPLRLSHAIQEVGKRLLILCLGLKGATVDGARVGRLRGRCLAGFLALGVELSDVRVVCHATIISMGGDRSGAGLCHLAN